jgi:hypothetical protein
VEEGSSPISNEIEGIYLIAFMGYFCPNKK